MGILFVSHSSRDGEFALRVRDFLRTHGWSQLFLDIDPEQGLAPGQRWQQQLKLAGERCSGVILLISQDWLASRWCQTEFLVADQLGKKIFPLLIAPVTMEEMPTELKGRFQFADASTPDRESKGLKHLAIGLRRAGLHPNSFPWPPSNEPHRCPYRGLKALEESDAGIFFGREAQITKAMDAMRRIRNGENERMLVILGASGAGKSSMLKAGLIARLKRDEENFIVLPIVRPGIAAVSGPQGFAASLGLQPAQLDSPAIVLDAMERWSAGASLAHRDPSASMKPATIVLPVDQMEELFTPENVEAKRAIGVLGNLLRANRGTVVVATIRSDSFHKLQSDTTIADIPLLPFSLPPLPLGAFKEVIEGPARVSDPPLTIDPALSDRLVQDLSSEDALPLLAFTLERLVARHPHGGTITLDEYTEDFGGIQGAIMGAVAEAFAEGMRDPSLPNTYAELERLARAAFIPALVHLEDTDTEPRRRVARLESLPPATLPLVRHLIDQRLLVCHKTPMHGAEVDTIEVTHEAILRQWPALRAWIAEERGALHALDAAMLAANEWRRHCEISDSREGQSWLAHRGARLLEAEALLRRPDFSAGLEPVVIDYLTACRSSEDVELLHEQRAVSRTRRLQRNLWMLMAVAGMIVLVAGAAIALLFGGMARQAEGTLVAQAARESQAQNYDLAARYALAAMTGAGWRFSGFNEDAEAELQGAASASSGLAVLRGHTDQVLDAAFSPDGRRVVTASRDGTARIWQAATGRQLTTFGGQGGPIFAAQFSTDGLQIVVSSADGAVRIWNVSDRHSYTMCGPCGGRVYSVSFSRDGRQLLTASSDGTARVWDWRARHQRLLLRLDGGQATGASFSPDGTRIVTSSTDGTSTVWDGRTGRASVTLRGHTDAVNSAVFSRDGREILTASDDGSARLWDAGTGTERIAMRGNGGALSGTAFSPDGQRIVTGSRDGSAQLWSARTGQQLAVLHGHDGSVNAVAFSPAGNRVVTASDDGTARIWSIAKSPLHLLGHASAVNGANFGPRGTRVVTASNDGTVRVWDAGTGAQILVLRGHQDLVESAEFSPDGRRIVSAADDSTGRIWDAATGRQQVVLRGHKGKVNSASFSPDGRRVVTASMDRTARIWDAITGRELRVLRGQRGGLYSASFSPDGRRVATASADMTAMVWDTNSGRVLRVLHGHTAGVSTAVFSPNGALIVTAGRDGTARLWDAAAGRQRAIFRGHNDALISAEFSADGRRLVTASRDETVRIWDVASGEEIAILRGHTAVVDSAVFSPDGHRILSASDDNTARIWNVAAIAHIPASALAANLCLRTLGNGLSKFANSEIQAAEPALQPGLNNDTCRTPTPWARLEATLWAGFTDKQ